MELTKHYEPAKIEAAWYEHWLSKGYFSSRPDGRPPFTVVIPPPNVTGVLHMGHTLNETVQDILVRKARMSGFNACWVPGSDHASIATEARVVQMLRDKGIDKNTLTREQFMEYAFEWKEKYGSIIYDQIARLGCSVDWDRVTFTMDDHYYAAVIKVFIDFFEKGLIYRGARMINWDPAARTALSDEEVEYKDVQGTLYYIRYPFADDPAQSIVIATQRPETIMGDTAICVNPNDTRYSAFKGKEVLVPLIDRKIPIVYDDYIDIDFGTGALKVTPAHDINDYNLGLKFGLPVIDTLNEDGTLSEAAEIFVGMDRFEARKKIVEQLRQEGYLVKEEQYDTRLGYSQRSNAVVEPRISTQWFVKMKELATPALEEVQNGNISIYPAERFAATYKYWLENVKDWCISRQLWWGQRIPAWYDTKGNYVVAENEADAIASYQKKFGKTGDLHLTQDEDVLDTWFSSWLWPMEVFNGISDPGNKEVEYYYPTAVLVTGQDIIFFWVARMIMAGMEYRHEKPFDSVYFTGMVRDRQGRKMSKSLGNSPDLLALIDQYGADAVRFGIMIAAPAGNDLLFDEASLEQGRNFNNKLWNALKLVQSWEKRVSDQIDSDGGFAIRWFENRLQQARMETDRLIAQFRLSEALKYLYSLIWDDFCSWYLEWVKPGFEQPIAAGVYQSTISFFGEVLQLLHPFMPFITEEIFHRLAERKEGDDLCISQFESVTTADEKILSAGKDLQTLLTIGREFRQASAMKNAMPIQRMVMDAGLFSEDPSILQIVKKQLNISEINGSEPAIADDLSVTSFPFKNTQIRFETIQVIDQGKRKTELEKELQYQLGFLATLSKKLGNERFVQQAKPEVIELETRKKTDTEARINSLRESLLGL